MGSRRPPPLVLAALAAVLLAGVLATALALRDPGVGRGDPALSRQPAAIEVDATLSHRAVLFGDTLRAHVDVVLDRSRVDPDSVTVSAELAPFEVLGRPEPRRRDAGDTVSLRTTFVLRCATAACMPSRQSTLYELEPVRVAFASVGGEVADASPISATLPALRVHSRFAGQSSRSPTAAPWQAELLTLPPVSDRLGGGVLAALLGAAAALATLAGLGLAYAAWPRRVRAAPPEPAPPPAPLPSPLEQALELLEESIRVDGAAAQRRALELVAEELELAEWGDRELARAARALAWSEDVPEIDQTSGLAARVRSALPERDESPGDGGARAV